MHGMRCTVVGRELVKREDGVSVGGADRDQRPTSCERARWHLFFFFCFAEKKQIFEILREVDIFEYETGKRKTVLILRCSLIVYENTGQSLSSSKNRIFFPQSHELLFWLVLLKNKLFNFRHTTTARERLGGCQNFSSFTIPRSVFLLHDAFAD